MRGNHNLDSISRKDGTIRAFTLSDHFGYQKWHRDLDKYICNWLENNKNASLEKFISFMNETYASDDLVKRFGKVVFGV